MDASVFQTIPPGSSIIFQFIDDGSVTTVSGIFKEKFEILDLFIVIVAGLVENFPISQVNDVFIVPS